MTQVPRKPDPRNAYLELHDGHYRVTMGVPVVLRPQLGNRLKRCLQTKSLLSANVLKVPVVREFKARIAKAWENVGGKERDTLKEAAAWAKVLSETQGELREQYADVLRQREEEILAAGARYETIVDDEGDVVELEIPTREARQAAKQFMTVAMGESTPLAAHHDAFMKTLTIKARSLTDDVRAIKLLQEWCAANDMPPYLERFDIKTAVRFVDDMPAFTGLGGQPTPSTGSPTALLGLPRQADPHLGEPVDGPIPGEAIGPTRSAGTVLHRHRGPEAAHGQARPGMMDVMMVAALTGARLDAVIDLRVGECADGWFTFKPQKKETHPRDVPIHPALRALVAARVAGKALRTISSRNGPHRRRRGQCASDLPIARSASRHTDAALVSMTRSMGSGGRW